MRHFRFFCLTITFFIPFTILSQESDSARFVNELEIANDFLKVNQFDSASQHVDDLFRVMDKNEYPDFFFKGMFIKVTILIRTGQLNEAQTLRNSLDEKIEESLNRPHEIFGWAAMLKAEILFYQRDFGASYDSFENAVTEFAPLETPLSHRLQGRVNNFMGIIHLRLSDFDLGVVHLNKSIEMYSKVEGTEGLIAGVQNNLSAIHMQQGKYQKALDGFFRVMEVRKKIIGENDPGLVSVYSNISTIYARMYQSNLALEYQERAFRIGQKYDNPSAEKVQQRHTLMAKMMIDMRMDSLASYHLNKAQEGLDSFSGAYPYEQAEIDLQWGYLLETLHESDKSIKHFDSAAKNFMKAFGEAEMSQVFVLVGQAYNYLFLEDFETAREKLKMGIELLHQLVGDEHVQFSEMHLMIADSYMGEENYTKALEATDSAISANTGYSQDDAQNFENVLSKNRLLSAFLTKAHIQNKLYLSTNENTHANQALYYYSLCDALVSELNQNEVYEDRLFTLDLLSEAYNSAVELYYGLYTTSDKEEYLEEAFYYADQSKNVILKQQLSQSRQKKYGSVPDEMLSMEQALKEDVSYLKSALYDLNTSSNDEEIDSTKVDYYNDQLFAKNRSLDSLKNVFKSDFPSYFNIRYDNSRLSISELQGFLSSESQVIQFLTTDSTIYVFSVTSKDADFIEIKKRENFAELLNQYLSKVNDPSSGIIELSKLGNQLSSQLLEPLGQLKEDLIIVPSGELNLLPFETLTTPATDEGIERHIYLIENHSISYANSLSVLYSQSKKKSSRSIELLALASTYSSNANDISQEPDTMRAGLGPLKWTVKEAQELVNKYDGEAYLDELATEANFRKHARGKNIIHIASHGMVDNDQPLFSRLVLERDPLDSINDGNLFVHELYNMSLDAQMVVLSACNTASGEVARGEGLLNIGRGFFYAGVPNVVMSHWQVDDQSTSILMKDFYQFLSEGQKKSDALRAAKLKFMTEASPNKKHPFYWGAFITMGDDSPVISKGVQIWQVAVTVSLLFFVFLATRRSKMRKAAIQI